MKFVQSSKFGGPEVLTLVEAPTPTPTEGTLLVEIRADIMQRTISSLKALHRAESRGKSWAGGETTGGRFCNVLKFRDDRISSLHIYLDPDYTGEDEARFRWGQDRHW